jgi:hypothetical protein
VEINNFKNIELHKVWVWDKNFETKIHYNDLNPWWSSILKTDWNKNFKTEIVKIVALDNYLPENIKVDFIKIDIEWFEYEAILWMENILKNNDLKIIFEFSPWVFWKEKWVKLLEKLANLGFKMKHINYEKWNYTEIWNLKEYTDSIKYQSDIFCEKVSKKIQNNTK